MSDVFLSAGIIIAKPGETLGVSNNCFAEAGWLHTVIDLEDGGGYKVYGTIAIDATPDIPGVYRVRLFSRRDGRMIRETFSNAAGEYAFSGVKIGPYFVVAHDHTNSYNAVVADNILGVAM